MIATDDAIKRAILDLTMARGPDKSICPSEVARAVAVDWRPMMAAVRRVAVDLVRADQIEILRHGRPVDPAGLRGVIRLRIRN